MNVHGIKFSYFSMQPPLERPGVLERFAELPRKKTNWSALPLIDRLVAHHQSTFAIGVGCRDFRIDASSDERFRLSYYHLAGSTVALGDGGNDLQDIQTFAAPG
jgi:hypothetical protein